MTDTPAPRPALILGAGSDIARALALKLAAEGRPIVLAGRNAPALERDAADIAIRCRVSAEARAWDAEDISSAGAFLDALPVMPAIVVSAVGLLGDQQETQGDPARIQKIVAVNFTGPAVMLEAAAERLAALPEDTAVIGIGSVAGDRGRARNYWYGAAKAALETMLSGLRQRFFGTRLLVMTVKPGFVSTAMTEGMDLPAALTLSADEEAELILKALKRRRTHAVHWKWRLLMAVIRNLPEAVFLRTKF